MPHSKNWYAGYQSAVLTIADYGIVWTAKYYLSKLSYRDRFASQEIVDYWDGYYTAVKENQ
jgi:hypothetical protein